MKLYVYKLREIFRNSKILETVVALKRRLRLMSTSDECKIMKLIFFKKELL